MPRRKPSDNKTDEIAYRLLQFIRQRESYGALESHKRLSAIYSLAHIWGVDVGPVVELMLKEGVLTNKVRPAPEPIALPYNPAAAPVTGQLPLTPETKESTLKKLDLE